MRTTDVFVIGGGPAGMAAAYAAGVRGCSVTLAEPFALGGRLLTHIEGGVGMRMFGKELTGPEYASAAAGMLRGVPNVRVLKSAVIRAGRDRTVETAGGDGSFIYKAKSVVLACGGRDVPFSACGVRYPCGISGIYSASDALALRCLFGGSVGKKAVIVGSGGDGLTAARRLALEGTTVVGVIERGDRINAGARMIRECLDDLRIPVYLSSHLTEICGDGRVREVRVSTRAGEQTLRCDAVVFAVGRLPDLSLLPFVSRDAASGIAIIDSDMMTSESGFFIAGGALRSCGLAERASADGMIAGAAAAAFAHRGIAGAKSYRIKPTRDVAYAVPSRIIEGRGTELCVRASRYLERGCIVFSDFGGNIVKRTDPRTIGAGSEICVRLEAGEVKTNLFVSAEEEK